MDMTPYDMGDLSHPVPLGVEGLEWQVLVFESMLDKMDTEYLREDSHERVLAVFPLTGEETKQTTEHLTHPYRPQDSLVTLGAWACHVVQRKRLDERDERGECSGQRRNGYG